MSECRPRNACDEHVAGSDTRNLALAIHDTRRARSPADAGWMAAKLRTFFPDIVGDVCLFDKQRACLLELDAGGVERPLEF